MAKPFCANKAWATSPSRPTDRCRVRGSRRRAEALEGMRYWQSVGAEPKTNRVICFDCVTGAPGATFFTVESIVARLPLAKVSLSVPASDFLGGPTYASKRGPDVRRSDPS